MSAATDLAHWIRLLDTPGVGNDTARKLLSAFGLPENIFGQEHATLRAVVAPRVAAALLAAPTPATLALIERTLAWAGEADNHVLTLADAGYPAQLLEVADPPVVLYAKGRIDLLTRASIAVVGSRNATAQGVANAEQFSHALTESGLTIVSGLALGIDTAAHQGSLRAAAAGHQAAHLQAATVAVIGTGVDIVYPARNRALAHAIAAAGCIVSEYALGTPAIASNFPRRNRIISGLSRGVLVIEAAARSGSLITARMAVEQGRDVFAIPGSIHSPLAKGCHQLIRQGAKLVESAQDILEELQDFGDATKTATESTGAPASRRMYRKTPQQLPLENVLPVGDGAAAPNDPVLQAMGFDPVLQDVLAMRCGMGSAELAAHLLGLELDGKVARLADGTYQRIGRARP